MCYLLLLLFTIVKQKRYFKSEYISILEEKFITESDWLYIRCVHVSKRQDIRTSYCVAQFDSFFLHNCNSHLFSPPDGHLVFYFGNWWTLVRYHILVLYELNIYWMNLSKVTIWKILDMFPLICKLFLSFLNPHDEITGHWQLKG